MTSTTHTFTELSHELSKTTGVYVISEAGVAKIVCLTRAVLRERLAEVTYDEASRIVVSLVEVDGWSSDNITHLIAQDWFGGEEDYEAWRQIDGEKIAFVEFWFDEWSSVEQQDVAKRYKARKPVTTDEPAPAAERHVRAA